MVLAIWATNIPAISKALGLTDGQLGAALSMFAAGTMLMIFMAGSVANKLGSLGVGGVGVGAVLALAAAAYRTAAYLFHGAPFLADMIGIEVAMGMILIIASRVLGRGA